MLAQVIARRGAKVEHLSPAPQEQKLRVFESIFRVVRLVKAVERKRLRTAAHKIVPQLTRQGLCQRGNARGKEIHLRAVLPPVVHPLDIRRFADGADTPEKRRGEIAHLVPLTCLAAERFGADVRKRRLSYASL